MAAPDAVQADPEHYTVEAEDDRVRVQTWPELWVRIVSLSLRNETPDSA
jgi:hypothetical protein